MLNRTVLVGRLTKDVDLKYTPNGVAVANFTLAVNRPFKSQDGEQQADFIQIQVWRKAAENAANYLSKGSLCGVDGRIQTRNYEGQDGKRVYVTEVIADQVQFLDSKKDSQQNNNQNQSQNQNTGGYGQTNTNTPNYQNNTQSYQNQTNNDPFSGGQDINITDDDLPF